MVIAGHRKLTLLGLGMTTALVLPLVAAIAMPDHRLDHMLIATLPFMAVGWLVTVS